MNKFERACDSMGLKINVGKSKVLTIKKEQMGSCERVRVNREELQEVGKFNYLGVMISKDGGVGEEVVSVRVCILCVFVCMYYVSV